MPDVRYRFLPLALAIATLMSVPLRAAATPALVMDVASGDVLFNEEATEPWYPASLTKLMTVYVALDAVRMHRISLDTPLVVSARAAAMPPSKMGFTPGTQVTLDNALKMLMVRSANDVAITVAEGVSGSVEAFADDMNQAASTLGLRESHFVNPNGLPNPNHVSSARDMAIIARALYLGFPEQSGLFSIGALALGPEIITNHNNLLGRYPGVDGMKTGFTCPAGFNVVASAYKDGRRLVTVILGAPSVAARSAKAAALFDRGFAGIDRPVSSIVALAPSSIGAPPDMRNEICRARGRLIAQFNSEVEQLDAPLTAPTAAGLAPGLPLERAFLFNTASATRPQAMATVINSLPAPVFDPVAVHIGAEPGYAGVVAQARPPHSAIGTEPDPAAAIAYASPLAATGLSNSPLAVDPAALPLKGRGRLVKTARAHKGHTMKAALEAPVTKVIAEDPHSHASASTTADVKTPNAKHPSPTAGGGKSALRQAAKGTKHANAQAALGDTGSDKAAVKSSKGKPTIVLPPKKPVAKAKATKPVASKAGAKDS